jgi:hypothetical protein
MIQKTLLIAGLAFAALSSSAFANLGGRDHCILYSDANGITWARARTKNDPPEKPHGMYIDSGSRTIAFGDALPIKDSAELTAADYAKPTKPYSLLDSVQEGTKLDWQKDRYLIGAQFGVRGEVISRNDNTISVRWEPHGQSPRIPMTSWKSCLIPMK